MNHTRGCPRYLRGDDECTCLERFQAWVQKRRDGGVHATPAECFNAGHDAGVKAERGRLVSAIEKRIEGLQSDFREADESIDDPELVDDIGQSVVLEGQAMAIEELRIAVAVLKAPPKETTADQQQGLGEG